MNENQKNIIKILKYIFYPVAIMMLIHFLLKFLNVNQPKALKEGDAFFEWLDKGVLFLVLAVVGYGVIALMQQFFSKASANDMNAMNAAQAKLLLKIEIPNQLPGNILLFAVALMFSAFLNFSLFSPETIFEKEEMEGFLLLEKILFGFFYVIAHFLVIVFGVRLFKGMPPVFIATEKGFCYEPAGISTGWILWEDVLEVRETMVLSGSSTTNGPISVPALGIKLNNPEQYASSAYAPLLQKLIGVAQRLNNYQTDGVGDVLIRPEDLGIHYEKVLNLLMAQSKKNKNYYPY